MPRSSGRRLPVDLVDRLLPGRITGFYVVGSAALGVSTSGAAISTSSPWSTGPSPSPSSDRSWCRRPTQRGQHRPRRDPSRPLTAVGHVQRDLSRRRPTSRCRSAGSNRSSATSGTSSTSGLAGQLRHQSRGLAGVRGARPRAPWSGAVVARARRRTPPPRPRGTGRTSTTTGARGRSGSPRRRMARCAPSPLVDGVGHARCAAAAPHDRHRASDLEGGRGRVRLRGLRSRVARHHRRRTLLPAPRAWRPVAFSIAHRATSTSASCSTSSPRPQTSPRNHLTERDRAR